MAHVSLYRKWRPRRFDQVVGQEPVVRTLTRAIETGKVAHAYLFSGPRGTGKTSTAKVLAMGINCAKGPTPAPCGECDSCRAIINNSSMDVLEMDAASNRGIDEIRELRDRVNLAPSQGRMKVYIVDEVHMLTTEAFNALLKLLEEPPAHVAFVLATTEPHKVLPTIVSRCQRFDFRRPGVDTLAGKLREIAATEGIEVEPEALTVIARAGKGSFRDAEGLLDQLSSFVDGPVTVARVRELLGSVDSEVLVQAVDVLNERRAGDALRIVDQLSNEGKDLGQFVQELLAHLRRLMLLPHAPEVALADVGAEEREQLEEQARRVPTAGVVRMIEALGDTLGRVKRGGDPKLELELCLLKLARDYVEPSMDALLSRLEALEMEVSGGASVRRRLPGEPGAEGLEEPGAEDKVEEPVSLPKREDNHLDIQEPGDRDVAEAGTAGRELKSDEREVEARSGASEVPDVTEDERSAAGEPMPEWADILRHLKDQRKALAEAVFRGARVIKFSRDVLEMEFPPELASYASTKRGSGHVEELYKVLEARLGSRPELKFRVSGGTPDSGTGNSERVETGVSPKAVYQEIVAPVPGHRFEEQRPDSAQELSSEQRIEEERPDDAPVSPPEPEVKSPGGAGGDDIIQDPREVLAVVRRRFGQRREGGR